MSRITICLFASCLILLNACISTAPGTSHKTEVEEVIRKKDLPLKVLMVLPKGYEEREFTYKRKLKDGAVSYDVYYEKGGDQFAINYDLLGNILKEERRIKLSDIPYDKRIKIEKILADHYPDYRILMVKQVYACGEILLEVFFSHPKSETGMVEAVFEFQTGALREFSNIRTKSISTFN
jgi:hypothetical protein